MSGIVGRDSASQYGAHWLYDFGTDKIKVLLHFDGAGEVECIEQELLSSG